MSVFGIECRLFLVVFLRTLIYGLVGGFFFERVFLVRFGFLGFFLGVGFSFFVFL